jgi:hypothetical protein
MPTTTTAPAERNQSTATPIPGPSVQAATPADDPITARWNALGGAAGLLGEPVGARQAVSGGERQAYQRGSIWWSPGTGAWETHDAIGTRYQQLGESASSLGFPTSGEVAVAGGVRQSYAGGAIWWSGRSGAWETRGAVGLRFMAIGDVTSWLGFPVGPEVGAADGVRQTFLGGNIWWSNHSGGAWETHGAINDDYWRGYGPQGWYGFPTSPEYGYYGGMRQDFEHGSLLWSVQAVADATFSGVSARDVWASWRPGCPVGPESLTLVRVNYWGFDNTVHRGEIIVRSDLAGRVASVLGSALADPNPVRQMWRVDYFRGDDPASMAADNTSGFNCRQVTGGTGLSPHSYGIAIDIDTVENPYYAGGRWWPNTDYVDRNNVRWGMLFSGSLVTRAFAAQGYAWGGSYRDYQHFEFVG